MIISLTNLKSTNQDNKKIIHVWVQNDGNAITAKLQYTICEESKTHDIALGPNEEKEDTMEHDKSGMCVVIVEDKDSKEKTQKLLDLDAAKSS
jgi:low affinity Fe/Cu permease